MYVKQKDRDIQSTCETPCDNVLIGISDEADGDVKEC